MTHIYPFFGPRDDATPSSTIYFWAKTRNIQKFLSPRLTAIDGQRNICFVVQGATTWMQKRNLVRCCACNMHAVHAFLLLMAIYILLNQAP